MADISDGRAFVDLLDEHFPAASPSLAGHTEPLRTAFDAHALTTLWTDTFMWKGQTRAIEGIVLMRGEHRLHSTITLSAPLKKADPEAALGFALAIGQRFPVDFACVHPLTGPEVAVAPAETIYYTDLDTRRDPVLAITTFMLAEGLPDLYWATLLGTPYIELFTRELLASTPTYESRELNPNTWLLRLWPDAAEFSDPNSHERIQKDRERAKAHLGGTAFFPPSQNGKVPHEFRAIQRPSNGIYIVLE